MISDSLDALDEETPGLSEKEDALPCFSSFIMIESEIKTQEPASNKKQERKAANRLTAKKSRDKKMAYVQQLENELKLAHERIAELTAQLNYSRHLEMLSSFDP